MGSWGCCGRRRPLHAPVALAPAAARCGRAVPGPPGRFFFSSRRRHTRFKCDWSSDVCSSDLWPSSSLPGFSLSASPSSLTFLQGAASSTTTTITIHPLNGFNGNVTLTASGLPSGVSASFGTNPATTSSLLTLSAAGTATVGTYTVTVTGTSGTLTNSATVALTVNAPPNYSLSASPSSVTMAQGTTGASNITVSPQNGFNSSVSLSASGLPSGVTASFNPTSTPSSGTASSSTLTLTASSTATTGTVTVTVTGTSGSLTKTTTISLTVQSIPTLPSVWSDGDIGAVGLAGSANYASGTFTVAGTGQGAFLPSSACLAFCYQVLCP